MAILRRPLTARNVIASVLLGTQPPILSARRLVRAGELFGINSGTIRVGLTRMVANGELQNEERGYRLTGSLLDRQIRQDRSRNPHNNEWNGDWIMATVRSVGRSPTDRTAMRRAFGALRMAELREGVWLRPANFGADQSPDSSALVAADCIIFVARPEEAFGGRVLARQLWDLEEWQHDADELLANIGVLAARLNHDDVSVLAPGFVESAAVLRLLLTDPLLPAELAPSPWSGDSLRREYDEFDTAYRMLLHKWLDSST